MHFKLVHFRLAPIGWIEMGKGLALSTSLRTFTVHGTNLANGENVKHLLMPLIHNTSLETLNLADNDLRDGDENAGKLLLFLQLMREKRD